MKFKELRDKEFSTELAKGKKAIATKKRSRNYDAGMANDGNPETFWAAPDKIRAADIFIDLGSEMEINRILLQEYIKLGQRISRFSVHALEGTEWKKVTDGTTIGYKVIKKFPLVRASKVKLSIEDAKACPTISNLEIFRAPGD
jgi:alpha-L-fucosidase